jgi:hypothetical protein
MPFMQKQITSKQNWLLVETTHGTECVPAEQLNIETTDTENAIDHPLFDTVQTYTEGEPQSWENKQGYGARLSAPGYMDCTEWSVFDSPEEAEKYLAEMYDEEEEEDGK